jgi:hypothetical protein
VTDALAALGVRAGDAVRWRPKEGARWATGAVTRVERDGSIGLTDGQGRARALPIDRLEVRASGPRGARTWEPLTERVARTEQMELFS